MTKRQEGREGGFFHEEDHALHKQFGRTYHTHTQTRCPLTHTHMHYTHRQHTGLCNTQSLSLAVLPHRSDSPASVAVPRCLPPSLPCSPHHTTPPALQALQTPHTPRQLHQENDACIHRCVDRAHFPSLPPPFSPPFTQARRSERSAAPWQALLARQ